LPEEGRLSTSLVLTDPRHDPEKTHGPIGRWAISFLRDERDLPFLRLMAEHTFVQIPFAIALFVPGVFRWWLGALYVVLTFTVFFDRFILMLHNTSHRPLFAKHRWMRHYIPWVIGPFCGQTPETYFAHHMGMHHIEGNLEGDLSTTMPFQRDSFLHFLRYFGRFFFLSLFQLAAYHVRKGNRRMARRLLTGEALFFAMVVALGVLVDWRPTLVVFVVPFLAARWLMMCGNWAQHAFIDASAPEDDYKSSITCVNTRYNRRCFNDGYHIGHHERAGRHWTEMPEDFESKLDVYRERGAVVFDGIDYFQIWALLMLKRYRSLAEHFVDLEAVPRSRDEIVALLESRTRAVVRERAA
jgi:hypothetical protein